MADCLPRQDTNRTESNWRAAEQWTKLIGCLCWIFVSWCFSCEGRLRMRRARQWYKAQFDTTAECSSWQKMCYNRRWRYKKTTKTKFNLSHILSSDLPKLRFLNSGVEIKSDHDSNAASYEHENRNAKPDDCFSGQKSFYSMKRFFKWKNIELYPIARGISITGAIQ
jgi:hypothetical protein